ncbi:MAG: ATP-binding cassette domain-containing protein [Gammaproteobacteria bacterium]|nr:ATP-binding cassette domain-containing protein [Gammaproteobacteria bacterium]
MLLRLDGVSLAFGSRPLLDHVDLQVGEGERVCLIGRNGEGKSSLLRLVAGRALADDGEVWTKPGARIALLAQDLDEAAGATVLDVVKGGVPAGLETWEVGHRIDTVCSRLGLEQTAKLATLSGGWRRRVLLGRALVAEPDVLLLDEPTNHLDIAAIEWLEEAMAAFRGALLFVSHDRAFVNRLATRIVELDRGRLSSWPGNYEDYVARKTLQLDIEAKANADFDRKLAQEEVWIRKGVEARRTRNEGRVRALQAMRRERQARRERTGSAEFAVAEAGESSRRVFEAEAASVRFGERQVIRDFSTRIMRGDRVGIVGPNGAGKSTLIKLLLGELEPTSGEVIRGARLEVAYYDQQREQLELEASIADNVNGGNAFVPIGGENRHVSGYLRDFLFRPDQLLTPAKALSGGERNRLLLARLFARPANLLVMDEPTNDLDIDTLELLEERVAGFEGTLLLVSHDRAFLDRVVTSLLVLEGDGEVREFIGGWSDWRAWRDARDLQRRRAAAPATSAATASSSMTAGNETRRRRLSFNEQREFDALPARIEELESRKAELDALVADGAFYSRPHGEVRETLALLQSLGEQIETAYARWQELESRR